MSVLQPTKLEIDSNVAGADGVFSNRVASEEQRIEDLKNNAETLEKLTGGDDPKINSERATLIQAAFNNPEGEEAKELGELTDEEKRYQKAINAKRVLETAEIAEFSPGEEERYNKWKLHQDAGENLKTLASEMDSYLYTYTQAGPGQTKEITAGRSMKAWQYKNQEKIDELVEGLGIAEEDVIKLLEDPNNKELDIQKILGEKIPSHLKKPGMSSLDKLLAYKDNQINKEHRKDLEKKGWVKNKWTEGFTGYFEEDQTVLGKTLKSIEPTAAVVELAASKIDIPTFRNLTSDQQTAALSGGFDALIGEDADINSLLNSYAQDSIPLLNNYKKELENKYANKTPEDAAYINKLLMDKQRELTIGKLIENPVFLERSTAYGMAIGEVGIGLDKKFIREDSTLLSALDWFRGGEDDWLPFNDTLADLGEGILSGSVGIGSAIGDKAWGSYAGNRFRAQEKKANNLQQQINNGDFSADDKISWDNTSNKYIKSDKGKTAAARQKGLTNNVNYWQDEIVEQIEEIAETEEYLSVFKQANFDDGIGFSDIALTVGQALPHIGMAAGGTALGLATGGTAFAALAPILTYAGTAAMGLQMYGDNYWGAIEQNMADKGLDKESLAKRFPDKSKSEIDQMWKDAAIENLESGEGAHMGTSAAYAAAQTALESYGAQQMVKGTAKAISGVSAMKGLKMGSIFKSSWDDVGKWMLRGAIEKGEHALEEFGTEYMQEILGQMSAATQSGRDVTALIDHHPALQAGIGGAITGFMLPFSGSIYNQTKTQIRNTAADFAIKYRPESGFANRSKILNQYWEQGRKELQEKYKDRDTNPDQKAKYYDELNTLNNVRNANLKITGQTELNNISESQFTNLLDTYIDIENYNVELEAAKKEKNKPLENALKEEQSFLIAKAESIIKAERTTGQVATIMKDLGKSKEMIVVENEAELRQEAKKRNVALDPNNPTVGFFTNDGQFVVDKGTAAAMQEGNTAAHELLHKVLFNTLYDVDGEGNIKGKNVARGLALALDAELEKIDIDAVKDSKFKKKLELYKKEPAAYKAEEKIVLFADAIESGDLKFDEGVFTKIGDVIRRFLQAVGLKDIKFNSGRDVYNFLKDYNASIKKGKLNQAQKRMMEKGAEVGTDIRRVQGTEGKLGKVARENKALEAKAVDSYEQTNELLADEDFDIENSLDQKRALKAAKPVILAATNRLWRPGSLLTKPQFIKALENEYTQSLTEYDVARDTGTGAGSSLSTKFNLRANAVAKENIGKGEAQSTDSPQAKQVKDTTQEKDFDEKVAKEDKQRKKKYATQNRVVDREIAGKIKTQIKENTRSTIGTMLNKGESVESIVKALETESKKLEFKDVKGKKTLASKEYAKFVNDLFDSDFVKNISVADMKSRFGKLFNVKEIGTTPATSISPKTGKKGIYNKQVFSVEAPPKQSLKDYFIPKNLKDLTAKQKDTYVKRAESLFDLIAKDTKIEALQELKNDKEYMQKLDGMLKAQKSPLTAEQFIDAIDQKLDKRNLEDASLDKVKANKALQDISQAKGINAVKKELGIKGDITTTEANRKARQKSILKSIKEGNIPSVVVKLLGLGNFGRNAVFGDKNNKYSSRKKAIKAGIKNPIKYFTTTTGSFINSKSKAGLRKNISKRNDWVAARGSLYYGIKDPAYEAMMKEARGNNKNYSQKALDNFKKVKRIKIPKGKKLTAADKKANTIQEKINQQALQDFGMMLNKAVNEGVEVIENDKKVIKKMPIEDAALLISQAYQGTSALIKIAAPFSGVSQIFTRAKSGKQVTKSQNYIEEHSPPASTIGASMIAGLKNNNMAEVMQGIKDNFIQIQLATAADRKLDLAKLNDRLPEGMSILTPNVGYLRLAAAGININTITDLETGKSGANIVGLVIPKSEFNNPSAINYQNRLMVDMALKPELTLADAKARIKVSMPIQVLKNNNVQKANKILNPGIFNENRTADQIKETMLNSQETAVKANKVLKEKKGISVFDMDDTLAITKEEVLVSMPDGTLRRLSPAQFAEQAQALQEQGAEFDFSQFEDVKGAKKGPLADLALKRQGKFGSGDIYVLTARPQISAQGIKTFLDGIGLNIPIENITGLEDGSPQAKADWVLAKTAQGYNDFYFADDSKMNVDAVKQILDQVDVKSEVQQAKANKTIELDKEFNQQIEEVTGKEAVKEYSKSRAKLEGKAKDKGFFKWLGKQLTITPSAEDFLGMMYDLMGVGEQGNKHSKWIADNLINPYNKAEQQILSAKVALANDFAALKKQFPSLRSKGMRNPLMQKIGVGPYTRSHAIRVYAWTKQGMEIPGLSKRDQNALVKAVESDNELNVFADEMILIQKDSQYPPPSENWTGGTIKNDILQGLDKNFRRKAMTEFDENVEIIFSEKNLNKLEAIFGSKWVESLKDSLRRMKSGSNRPVYQGGGARIVNSMLDWLNGSVGAIMFVNMRSGLLQLISNINFINWGDNNIYAAAKAFASKEYWPTVLKLMNSDYLVNRRDGLKINVNEAELADAANKNGMQGAISYLLDKGFIITRIMDSLAIATGGATFYINRRNALLKRQNPETGKKYTQAEAEAQAFDDFYAIAEETQQSSNPSKISQQQASLAGRVILSFQNVTMQYNRKVKKSIRNLYNRRKNPGMTQRESDLSNISQIVYYTTIQNMIFHSLQQTLFALAFDPEEDEEEKRRAANIVNGMADSLLFGLGFGGAAISTVKNVLRVVAQESDKKSPDYEEAVWEVFNVSPVLDSKVRKLRTTAKTFSWNMEEIKKRGWSLDNPTYLAVSQLISAATNIPIDRVLRKTMNLRMAMDEETRTWQRVALILGWSSWSVGLPYWGLQSTIDQEEKAIEKAKVDYKNDIRKMKAQGYKKVMYRNLEDFDPKDIVELRTPAGTVVYYVKVGKGKQVKN